MNTPCRVLQRSVIRKNGLFGDIKNEMSSMTQSSPAITDNRKYNVKLKLEIECSILFTNKRWECDGFACKKYLHFSLLAQRNLNGGVFM